jgi:predicted dehydrogenase
VNGDAGFRWGIAGPGAIAARFADGMRGVAGGTLVAVGSRSAERADAFARRFDIARGYGSYEELAADDAVDAVYVATPASRHADDALLFLGAGKHVLCEKPFTLNATQTSEVVRAAREHDRFVMEAMWSRFLPANVPRSSRRPTATRHPRIPASARRG